MLFIYLVRGIWHVSSRILFTVDFQKAYKSYSYAKILNKVSQSYISAIYCSN